MAKSPIQFLSVEDVLVIHQDTITHDGGSAGLRDHGLLVSAVMMPQQMFDGRYLHRGVSAMGAAYLYHLTRNHPFVDGNKRVGVMSMLVFFDANAVRVAPAPRELEALTRAVAEGAISKSEVTRSVRAWTRP